MQGHLTRLIVNFCQHTAVKNILAREKFTMSAFDNDAKKIVLWFFTTKMGGAISALVIILWAIGRLTIDTMDTSG